MTKIIGSFYEKQLLLSTLQRSCYSESDSHTRDKFKAVLDSSNYATKKLNDTKDDTSDLGAKRDFIAFKAEFDNLDINEMVIAPTGLDKLKRNADVDKLQTIHVNLKK